MRKETSTNFENEKLLKDECAMIYTLSLINGRWKPLILWRLLDAKLRYSELKKAIPAISERMLNTQLRELEKDNLVSRTVIDETPIRVEYEMTELGETLRSVLMSLSLWGTTYQQGK